MKKLVITFVLVSLTTLTQAQEYPNLKKDDSKITETDNAVFKTGSKQLIK